MRLAEYTVASHASSLPGGPSSRLDPGFLCPVAGAIAGPDAIHIRELFRALRPTQVAKSASHYGKSCRMDWLPRRVSRRRAFDASRNNLLILRRRSPVRLRIGLPGDMPFVSCSIQHCVLCRFCKCRPGSRNQDNQFCPRAVTAAVTAMEAVHPLETARLSRVSGQREEEKDRHNGPVERSSTTWNLRTDSNNSGSRR